MGEQTSIHRETLAVYERQAEAWQAVRKFEPSEHANWVGEVAGEGSILDLGCGPGWYSTSFAERSIAADPASAMLDLVPAHAPGATRIAAAAGAVPFAAQSLAGAVASKVFVHLPRSQNPLAFADLHRALRVDAPVFLQVFGDQREFERVDLGRFPGRWFSGWDEQQLRDAVQGAGFSIESFEVDDTKTWPHFQLRLRRERTLADTVAAGMRMLICGLNPSLHSADAGVGFARPGNRFWPAAIDTGLVSVDRDPLHALAHHGIGMTDLVKRATRRADELDRAEYVAGLQRVERLAEWLQPEAVCFVGLSGWRAAVDKSAKAGWQPRGLGGRPIYLMPSTSGLNAHSQLPDLTAHLHTASSGP